MEIVSHDDVIQEILIEDIVKTVDKGIVIIPNNPLDIKKGRLEEQRDDLTKEIIAYDSLELGCRDAAEVHGTGKNVANKYSNGETIEDPDVRARILGRKYNIADKAVAQLMDTLNLFDPTALEKQSDIIKAAGMLAGIVEKVSGEDKKGNGNEVHLHLYSPKQNKVEKYPIIDV